MLRDSYHFVFGFARSGFASFLQAVRESTISLHPRPSDVWLASPDLPQFTEDGDVGGYTNAVSLFPNGTWDNPPPEPSC